MMKEDNKPEQYDKTNDDETASSVHSSQTEPHEAYGRTLVSRSYLELTAENWDIFWGEHQLLPRSRIAVVISVPKALQLLMLNNWRFVTESLLFRSKSKQWACARLESEESWSGVCCSAWKINSEHVHGKIRKISGPLKKWTERGYKSMQGVCDLEWKVNVCVVIFRRLPGVWTVRHANSEREHGKIRKVPDLELVVPLKKLTIRAYTRLDSDDSKSEWWASWLGSENDVHGVCYSAKR